MVFENYKHLHRMPELSEQEYETTAYIEEALQSWGYDPRRLGSTGIAADLITDEKLPWLLLRADIDALPILEKSGVEYASVNNGVMHACGHDAHTSMLLEAARLLAGEELPQNIRFLFQPAEETSVGAEKILKYNIIPEKLQACFAMHVWPGVPECTLATCNGALMASCDYFKVSFHGKSAHCGQAYLGNDSLQSAVMLIQKLNELKKESKDDIILFCGSIHSGNAYNIVPDEAWIGGTMRTFSASVREQLKLDILKAAKESAECFGTQAQVEWQGETPAINNAPELVQELTQVLSNVDTEAAPSYAAEDFARYQEYAPGVLLWLGTGDTPPLHNEHFYVPEKVLYAGVEGWLKIAKHTFASGGVEE